MPVMVANDSPLVSVDRRSAFQAKAEVVVGDDDTEVEADRKLRRPKS